MKRDRLSMFIFILIISVSVVLAAQCTTERYNPPLDDLSSGSVIDKINKDPSITDLPYETTPCPVSGVSSPCNGHFLYDDSTALKLCQIAEYSRVISKGPQDSLSNCGDDVMWYWNAIDNKAYLKAACLDPRVMVVLTCERDVCKTQCQDSIDNDNDGKKDLNDNGCVDANDDNEFGEPYGYLDKIENCQKVSGWTCDPDDFNKALDVKIYKDETDGTKTLLPINVKADVRREDVKALCGGNPNHGFSFELPASLKDGVSHKIYAYGINILTPAKDVELIAPLTFICQAKCNADQTIFKTLTESSSNAALHNDDSFFNQICYDSNKIFGKKYPVPSGTDPHACINEKNVVLWLKTVSDSKVSTTKNSEFTIPVCYGDLKCRVIDTLRGGTQTPSEKIVASLASTTNSLVSEGNDTNYPIKIICKSQISLNLAYWTNMNDGQISEADIKDEVNLIAFGDKLENEEIKFIIKKQVGVLGIDFLAKDKVVAKETTKGNFTWKAGADDQGSFVDANGNWNSGDYYFEAILNGDASTKKSTLDNQDPYKYLIVTAPENNAPPIANIISPKDCNIFFLENQIQFTPNIYDIDNGFKYTWDFGDGTSLTGNSITRENFNPIHTYTGQNLGQKLIQLTVTDNGGLTSSDTVSILILNNLQEAKTYSCALISSPKNGIIYGREVNYDASESYTIQVEPKTQTDQCNKKITCIGGFCPTSTNGNPSCYPATDPLITIDSAPSSKSLSNYGPITFCWNHKNYEDNIYGADECIQGNNGKFFYKFYMSIGNKMSNLTIKTDIFSSDEVIFNVAFDKNTCLNNIDSEDPLVSQYDLEPGKSYWIYSGNVPTKSDNDCYKEDGVDKNGALNKYCCPNNNDCKKNNDDKYQCFSQTKDSCDDFTTKPECEGGDGHPDIAKDHFNINNNVICGNTGKFGDFCTKFKSCKCKWIEASRTCGPSKEDFIRSNVNKPNNELTVWSFGDTTANSECNSNSQDITYSCTFKITSSGNCDPGKDFYEERWTVDYFNAINGQGVSPQEVPPDVLDRLGCKEGSRQISCDKVIRLPFFDFKNLILSVLFLMIIYYFVLKRENKFHNNLSNSSLEI